MEIVVNDGDTNDTGSRKIMMVTSMSMVVLMVTMVCHGDRTCG